MIVLQLICRQMSGPEIAKKMKLNIRTVEDYRLSIKKKLGVKNMVGVALYALVNEMVDIRELKNLKRRVK